MILLNQMVILFLIMIAGYFARKRNIISESDCGGISRLVINVANPALIISAGINPGEVLEGRELAVAALLSAGSFLFLIISSFAVTSIIRPGEKNRGTYRAMTVFSNIGFIGFPIISAAYGANALLYASFFQIPYNVLVYTWGVSALGAGSGKKNGAVLSKIINAGVVSCAVTLALYLSRIPVPGFLETVTRYLANLTAPLSMMVIGASVVNMNFKELFGDVRLLVYCGIRQLLLPVAGVLIARLVGVNDTKLLGVTMVMLACPVGAMMTMLSREYGGDYELASRGVALSTIMSVATIPAVSMILGV